ncbi:limbin-like [Orbicella faveolata]|uniref:limbin-like n=1 Tax=Orbicella faveolata TaxID=48498 RepID=UPI0009E63401|nr:limbin-like [Orbicella faveolata]
MFIKALKLLARKLRVKREISSEQENKFGLEIKQAIGAVAFKMAAEYKRKSAELRNRLQKEGKSRLDALHREQRKEREETENKIKGLVNEREKKNILELLKRRQDAQEQELKQNLKLEQDVEMEKLRKEVSISKRFALKESQNKLIQDLIKDSKLNEEQASAIMKNHLSNMAAIDKATDEERTRRVMALEMRLAERRALARQKQEEEERKKKDLGKLEENQAEALENLVRSSNLNSEDAAVYLERFRKEVEVVDNKLAKDRKRQEQKLHQKLTALKQKRIEEKAREHQRQMKEFEDQQDEKFEQVEIDTVAAISEKQKMLQKQRQEIEEIERNSDREAAEEVETLRDQQLREGNQMIKNNVQKMYQELVNKGLSESEKEAILERHMADVAMQQDAREQERRRQREMLEKRLEKQRAALEKKMKEEQAEQAEVRKQEDKIVGDLIVNQVAMSEEERDRIIQEHERNLAELESSLTLNKLRQRQMLEDKLAERRKRRMQQLEQKQMNETKVLADTLGALTSYHHHRLYEISNSGGLNSVRIVREEMLAERSKRLEEHHEKLGAIIAKLQIEKAKQRHQLLFFCLFQNIKLISILVQQGKLQEEELESVLKFLFPAKSSNKIDELLSKIYGPGHTKESKQTSLDPRRPSALEARIRRASAAPITTPPPIREVPDPNHNQ